MTVTDDSPEWIRHRVKRWAGSTRVGELSAAQRGVYHEVLVFEALRGPFVFELERMARLMRLLPAELSEAWPVLVELGLLTQLEDGRWSNETVAEERARALKLTSKRAAAGRQGARKRWGDGKPSTEGSGRGDGSANGKRTADANGSPDAEGEGEGDNHPPQPPAEFEHMAASVGGGGVDPPNQVGPPPQGPQGVLPPAPVPPWARAELDAVGLMDLRRRDQVATWAAGWRDPGAALRAAIARANRDGADPAGLLAHAVETRKADEWLLEADRRADAHTPPLAQPAVAWDRDLERVVLGLAGHEGGHDRATADELAHQRYGGPDQARLRFAQAVHDLGDQEPATSVRPVSAYRTTARQLLEESGVACG